MYQALYRKYRPQIFDEVYGQDVIIRILKNSILNNKISHAYLFAGPRGTGKTSIAKILAKTVNCKNLKNTIPCDECSSCLQINNHQNTDIIEIDAASNNGVDEIREIRNKVNLVPSNSKYKVYIIDEVHMLTTGAFNALLKTLEEPPKHVIFILATTEMHKIPATIVSRCQILDFKKISEQKIEQRLNIIVRKENINIEEKAIIEISRLADGGLRDAISMLDQVIAFSNEKVTVEDVHEVNGTVPLENLKKFINNIVDNDISAILDLIDEYNSKGKNLIKLTEEILIYLKDVLLYKNVPQYYDEKNIDYYREIADTLDESKLIDMIDILNNELKNIKYSTNPKLMLQIIVIKIVNLIANTRRVKNTQSKAQEKKCENEFFEKKEKCINQEMLEKLKKIRINNTLATFNRNKLLNLQKMLTNMFNMSFDNKYKELITTIANGKMKAVGNHNLIFVFDTAIISDGFNKNLLDAQKLLNIVFNEDYKVISTSADEWETIKKEFNSHSKQYVEIEEDINLEKIYESDYNDIEEKKENNVEKLFSNIIEYK